MRGAPAHRARAGVLHDGSLLGMADTDSTDETPGHSEAHDSRSDEPGPIDDRSSRTVDPSSAPIAAHRPAVPLESPLPFEGLTAPTPNRSAPPKAARWLAFSSILLGGLLGGLIGYGTGEVLGQTSLWGAIGALAGGLIGAVGVGIVSSLTLQAMIEWKAVEHPEAEGQ